MTARARITARDVQPSAPGICPALAVADSGEGYVACALPKGHRGDHFDDALRVLWQEQEGGRPIGQRATTNRSEHQRRTDRVDGNP